MGIVSVNNLCPYRWEIIIPNLSFWVKPLFLQLLPEKDEEADPSFIIYTPGQLPVFTDKGIWMLY
jgi:hypothetical protein